MGIYGFELLLVQNKDTAVSIVGTVKAVCILRVFLFRLAYIHRFTFEDRVPFSQMPKFLDVHSFHSLGESKVKELQKSPPDEFGVKHLSILYNRAADLCFCLLEAPNREAVEKHHEKINLKCDWITQVESAA